MPPRATPPELPRPRIIPWDAHQLWLDRHWMPGQHCSIVAPTGGGKSYLIRYGLLPVWANYRILLIDVKGDDPTYAGFGKVVTAFPQEEAGNNPPEGERVYRLIVPRFHWSPNLRKDSDGYRLAQEVVGTALDRCYVQGQWVVVSDETRALTDSVNNFGLGLRGLLENIWQRGRSRQVTLIAGTQQPIWMPSSFYSQPSLVYMGRMLEPPGEHLKEVGGDSRVIRVVVPTLARQQFLVIERDTGRMAITKVVRTSNPPREERETKRSAPRVQATM